MKRVVHLTSVHYPFDTRIFYKECQSLAAAGYEVHLVAPHEHNEVVAGVQLHAVPKPAGRFARLTRTIGHIYQKARALRAPLYHIHDPELLPVGYLLAKQKAQVIFDVHENVPAQLLTKHWLRWPRLVSRLYARVEHFFVKGHMRLILAEYSYHTHYARLDPACITVLNFPLHVSDPILPYGERNNIIAYVGGIARVRGLDQTLEALALLRTRGLQPTFSCIGPFASAQYATEARQRVKDLNISQQVHFLGHMKNSEALQYISHAKLGLSILHPVPNYIESYSTKIFEYMTLGMPFIVSDFPLYKKILNDAGPCGLLVDPLNPEKIADALEYILTHPREAAEMGKRGREAIEKQFNWSYEKEKLIGLYELLLK